MRYKVPKFLEREMKFFNFITFKQLAILGGIGLVLVILYYILPTALFFFIAVLTGGGAFALMFVRIQGVPLSKLLFQWVKFFILPRKYIWEKKTSMASPIRLVEKTEPRPEKEEKSSLRIFPRSRLGNISARIEMGLKD